MSEPWPLGVCVWELTLACNARCVHCGSDAGKPRPGELDTARALALVAELAALGCRSITFSGGEPLLRPDWKTLARAVRAAGIELEMITNGLVVAEQADAIAAAGFSAVTFSIDGPAEVHDALPGGNGGGRRITQLVRNVDVMPTLASLLGWQREPWPSDLDGQDLAGVLATGSIGTDLDAVSVRNHDCITTSLRPTAPADLYTAFALTGPRFRQVWQPGSDRWQAFDLESDPGELADLGSPPELAAGVARLRGELARARVGEFLDDDAEALKCRLRQWGYVE